MKEQNYYINDKTDWKMIMRKSNTNNMKKVKESIHLILGIVVSICLNVINILRKIYYRIPERKRYSTLLCGLVVFVIVGSIFCVRVDSERAKAAREEALRIEKEMQAEAERKAEEERKKKEEARRKSDSLQVGVPVGTFEQGEEKVVYMTFDDGPSENTKKVLEILDQYDAKATFFVTGYNESCRPYIKEAYEAGHTIGLHTFSHDYAGIYSSTDAFFRDLEQVGNVVKEQIGFVPCYTRFPGGASNTISANYTSGIMTQLTAQVPEKGYQYYDWNWNSGDGANISAEEVYQNSIGCEENQIILLFHDSTYKQSTIDALPRIMDHYKERGYEFREITRDTYVVHHGVNN